MDPSGETAGISFPFRRVAAAFAIRLISGGHEHDKLDPMTAFTRWHRQVDRVVFSLHFNCIGSISPPQFGRLSSES